MAVSEEFQLRPLYEDLFYRYYRLATHADEGEKMSAGATAGNDQFHGPSFRQMGVIFNPEEIFSRIPTANRLISSELPP